ncbi:uncharacterized protein B0I36DRAFT_290213 [Microdochium trichocladiopsis]|uniref:FAD-binding PCMH-type domain-containing protein n=1 Tax=Microdochium trichocladiopsis TaxID=1682393 RepID=A0A9P8Y5S9_9PEZI|nr:uncharacterized protein B0I36DRAFT_290213 [Microdochium trichocladiopsis]KAH7028948.1 hypothetical protein B0I36DRAFT_290213 [Microdochium trichocladiopsis]
MAAVIPKSLPPQVESLRSSGVTSKVLVPNDPDYAGRQSSFWSVSAQQLSPAAIVLPDNANEVASIVKSLVAAGQPFAARSGGHTNWAGSNNIDGGVTIDLSQIRHVRVSEDKQTADIGPGGKWREVYAELDKHGLAVAGGREGNVGVAGLILGGGNTFFTARRGFACDNVVEYQVVLASGEIVTASKHSNEDLFCALKGGSNNFGIVTNFKMAAIPCSKVWGGMSFLPKATIPAAIDALVDFVPNVASDDGSNLVCIFTHMPDFKDVVVATFYANVDAVESPPIYKKWLEIPRIMDMIKMTSIKEMAFEYNIPAGHHVLWFTLCFKNDATIVTKAVDLHEILVEQLKTVDPEGGFTTQCLFQPLPKLFGQRGAEAGGNVMGIENQSSDGLLWLATAMMKTAEHEAQARPLVEKWVQDVKDFAASNVEEGVLPWTYLNYADPTQAVLASYGAGNVQKIRDAAAKYDPEGVFQKLCPGGFKISDVKS